DIYKIIQKRDYELGLVFDGHSRSRADQKLRDMYNKGLVTDDELSKFSEETQNLVKLRFGHAPDFT
ncbi:MAG: hypothetical protein WBN41_06615, partial [Lysobacterales bacterium]